MSCVKTNRSDSTFVVKFLELQIVVFHLFFLDVEVVVVYNLQIYKKSIEWNNMHQNVWLTRGQKPYKKQNEKRGKIKPRRSKHMQFQRCWVVLLRVPWI